MMEHRARRHSNQTFTRLTRRTDPIHPGAASPRSTVTTRTELGSRCGHPPQPSPADTLSLPGLDARWTPIDQIAPADILPTSRQQSRHHGDDPGRDGATHATFPAPPELPTADHGGQNQHCARPSARTTPPPGKTDARDTRLTTGWRRLGCGDEIRRCTRRRHHHPGRGALVQPQQRRHHRRIPRDRLRTLRDQPGRGVIVDGEIVAPAASSGHPRFDLLQLRTPNQDPPPALQRAVPVAFYIFDLLAHRGAPILRWPYLERRQLLADLNLDLGGEALHVPPHWVDVDSEAMLEVADEHGLEGIVTKRMTSPYQPGRRSPDWVKTPLRNSAEVIVGGWEATSHGGLRSLIVGAHSDQVGLVFIGHVSSGFTEADRRRTLMLLRPLERPTSPFDDHVPDELAAHARWSNRLWSAPSSTASSPRTGGSATRRGRPSARGSTPMGDHRRATLTPAPVSAR